jgi:phenylalanyl-tRNA synthetase beta chain
MEYSLQALNKIAFLKDLTIDEIVNKLNLIGFEVDNVFIEPSINNSLLESLRIFISIPSNREDLLNEKSFLQDLSSILGFELDRNVERAKKSYYPVLNKKYLEYSNYRAIEISSSVSDLVIYNVELEGLKELNSPVWVQNKLKNFGHVPSGTIEDILDLVKLEWGQSFEMTSSLKNSLGEHNLNVKRLTKRNKFVSNNKEYDLKEGTIVLTDSQDKIITFLGLTEFDLSNIIDGKACLRAIHYDMHKNPLQINPLESAVPLRQLRNEFLQNFRFSFQRLLTLLEIIYSVRITPEVSFLIKDSGKIQTSRILKVRKKALKDSLNLEEWDLEVFKRAGLKIINNGEEELSLEIPNYRNDLLREIDVIEEYSRFLGYKSFQEIKPVKRRRAIRTMKNQSGLNFVKQSFLNYGFCEVMNSSVVDERTKKAAVVVSNPFSEQFGEMRADLLSGLINTFVVNVRLTLKPENFFEIGRVFEGVFRGRGSQTPEAEKLGAIFYGDKVKAIGEHRSKEWFLAKGLIEGFLVSYGYNDKFVEFIPLELQNSEYSLFHKKRSVILKLGNKVIGVFGEISPAFARVQNSKYSVYLFELNLSYLNDWQAKRLLPSVKGRSRYPLVVKDLSFRVERGLDIVRLQRSLLEQVEYVLDVYFFDVYAPERELRFIDVGLRIEFQSREETMDTETIDKAVAKIIKILKREFDADFRDEKEEERIQSINGHMNF